MLPVAHLDIRALINRLLHQPDEVTQLERASVAQVQHLAAERGVHRRHHAIGDVIDVRVVTRRGAVSILLDGSPTVHARDELERSHVWSATRPVHCEEPQTRAVQTVQMMERVRQQLTTRNANQKKAEKGQKERERTHN